MWHHLKVLFFFWLLACAGGLIYKHLIVTESNTIFERDAEVERIKDLPKPVEAPPKLLTVKNIEASGGIPTLKQVLHETAVRIDNTPVPDWVASFDVEQFVKVNREEELSLAAKKYKQKYKTATIRFFQDYDIVILVVTFILTIVLLNTHIALGLVFMSVVSFFSLYADNNYVVLEGFFFSLTWFPAMLVAGMWILASPFVIGLVLIQLPALISFIFTSIFYGTAAAANVAIGAAEAATQARVVNPCRVSKSTFEEAKDFAAKNPITAGYVASKMLPSVGKLAEKNTLAATILAGWGFNKLKK